MKTVTEIYTFSNNTSLASESQKFQGPVSMVAVSMSLAIFQVHFKVLPG